jgi:hypothetical protein
MKENVEDPKEVIRSRNSKDRQDVRPEVESPEVVSPEMTVSKIKSTRVQTLIFKTLLTN